MEMRYARRFGLFRVNAIDWNLSARFFYFFFIVEAEEVYTVIILTVVRRD